MITQCTHNKWFNFKKNILKLIPICCTLLRDCTEKTNFFYTKLSSFVILFVLPCYVVHIHLCRGLRLIHDASIKYWIIFWIFLIIWQAIFRTFAFPIITNLCCPGFLIKHVCPIFHTSHEFGTFNNSNLFIKA